MTTQELKPIITNVFAPVLVAVIVGLASSFFMGQVMLAKIETRMDRAEQDIVNVSKEVKSTNIQTNIKYDELKRTRDLDRESFVRLETKIDILLDAQRKGH